MQIMNEFDFFLFGVVGFEEIVECICMVIFEYWFVFGVKLMEVQFCDVFGVKCGMICQVFVQFVIDKLVDFELNCGVFVVSLMLQDVYEVFEMCWIIELVVVEWFVIGFGVRCLKGVVVLIDKECKVFEWYDFVVWIWLLGEFYMVFVMLMGNVMFSECFEGFVVCLMLMLVLYDLYGCSLCLCDDYDEIFVVLEVGDLKQVVMLMVCYLQYVELKMLDWFV